METCSNVWVKAYTPDGYNISITVQISSVADVARVLDDIRAAGYTPVPANVEDGEKHEVITAVVRRTHSSDKGDTPVIDCYPEWKGDYGQYRFVSIYLNNADEIKAFEDASGLKLSSLPEYASQAPLQRTQGKPAKWEVTCKRAFTAVKAPNGEKEIGGKTQTVYRFTRYAGATPAQPASNDNGASAPALTVVPKSEPSEWVTCKPVVTAKKAGNVMWYKFTGADDTDYFTSDADAVFAAFPDMTPGEGENEVKLTPLIVRGEKNARGQWVADKIRAVKPDDIPF